MTPRTHFYIVHSISIQITAPKDIACEIDRRLGHFRADGTPSADLNFDFVRIGSRDCLPPPGAGRKVYELQDGLVHYDPETDVLSASYGDLLWTRSEIKTGRTTSLLRAAAAESRLATHLVFTLALVDSLRRRGLFNLHAAALCRNSGAVLIAGRSGSGKSTLTLAMTNAGWDYLSDDMVFLRAGSSQVLGFPEGIDCVPENSASTRKEHIRPETRFGAKPVLEAQPCALLLPAIAHRPESAITRLTPEQAFLELVSDVLMTDPGSCREHLAILADLTSRVPAWRLHTGTRMEEAARLISWISDQRFEQATR